MNLANKKKGQSSVEFVLIASVMFLVFLGMFAVIQGRLTGAYKNRLYNSMTELSNVVATEIRLAGSFNDYYSREFYIPYVVSGYEYSISLQNQNEIVISSEDLSYVLFLDINVSGDIDKGINLINKTDDNITITNFG
ncbi:MAG: pilus assembly protein [Nanoarchaeota archaeon]|nr:pilus assembly protein [Nanoarchaeota archaeon]MBU1321606.1 pilus assembly protein [Nanoarchaeota archaeon]MBU1598000.1 pilus assembly protein [Nanoarchaeota archaeon]MBU2440950.1 pilus assembly protein [Nanoarchaeota archaeon]